MGEITRTEENIVLPLPLPDQEIDYEYMRTLVGELNKRLGEETNTTLNLLLDRTGDTDAVYIGGLPDETGAFPNGTWRIKVNSSGELSFEKKVSGSWIDTPLVIDV